MGVMYTNGSPDFTVRRDATGRWSVALPHQCDSWDIAGEGDTRRGIPHKEAIAELESFLVDGQAALEALKRGEEFGPEL